VKIAFYIFLAMAGVAAIWYFASRRNGGRNPRGNGRGGGQGFAGGNAPGGGSRGTHSKVF